jgi:excisionase family DNA binding protein
VTDDELLARYRHGVTGPDVAENQELGRAPRLHPSCDQRHAEHLRLWQGRPPVTGNTISGMTSVPSEAALPDRKTLAQWVIETEQRAELAEQACAEAEQRARTTLDAATAKQLLTVSEAAAALRISKTGLYRLFSRGELRWVQVGAHRRVTREEIGRFCDRHACPRE